LVSTIELDGQAIFLPSHYSTIVYDRGEKPISSLLWCEKGFLAFFSYVRKFHS